MVMAARLADLVARLGGALEPSGAGEVQVRDVHHLAPERERHATGLAVLVELGFLAGVYLLSTALLPPALLQVKFRGGNVEQVWACFVVFQICRALCFTGRVWGGFALTRLFHRRTRKPVKAG